MKPIWNIRPSAPEGYFARFSHLPRPIAQLLYNRGIRTLADADVFLSREIEVDNPFKLRGMVEAVQRLRLAIERGEGIIVHGDFDADGVTSTAVMVIGLHALGARVGHHIPHRVDEGYGLNGDAIRRMHEKGFSLIVTVDCGIRSHSEIELANELGMDVIVTDHHSVPDQLPPALAVVNPKQPGCEYPHKMLVGVGLAWKTIQALWRAERKTPLGKLRKPLNLNALLDLVAIGTVADVGALSGENRRLVWQGLQQLQHTEHPGLVALMKSAHVNQEQVNAESIGFFLGPRLNAAGRLDHANLAYELLRAHDGEKADNLAEQLEAKNRERQALTLEAMGRAEAQLTNPEAALLMISDERCPEGIMGLVAGRLAERYFRPTIIVAQGRELSRASCRSIPGFDITRALDQVSHLLERHGGHAAAAGFTVRTENLHQLERALRGIAEEALGNRKDLVPKLEIDGNLPLHEIDEPLVDAIEQLAPFGEANRLPLWCARDVLVQGSRAVGNGGSHLQLTLLDQRNRAWHAIAFRQGSRQEGLPPRLDIAFSVKRSEWNGRKRLELHLEDFEPARESVPAR